MRVLLVEDDENKRAEVARALLTTAPDATVVEARSYHSALRKIEDEAFDRIVLDMTMPTFDITRREGGGMPQAYGGRELLRLMQSLSMTTPTVVLTQFDRFGEGDDLRVLEELDGQLRQELGSWYLGAVYYNVAEDQWRQRLAEFIADGDVREAK